MCQFCGCQAKYHEDSLNHQHHDSNQQPLMQFFTYEHLPPHLKEVSKPFCDMAEKINNNIVDSAEKTAGLRKLLEAKDCIVRAFLTQGVKS